MELTESIHLDTGKKSQLIAAWQICISLFFSSVEGALGGKLGCGSSPAPPCTMRCVQGVIFHLEANNKMTFQQLQWPPARPSRAISPWAPVTSWDCAAKMSQCQHIHHGKPPCSCLLLFSVPISQAQSVQIPVNALEVGQWCLGAGCSFPLSASMQPCRSNHFTGANKEWIKLQLWRTHLQRPRNHCLKAILAVLGAEKLHQQI